MPRCFWLMMEGGLMKFFGKGTTTRLSSKPSPSPSSSPSSSPSLPSSSSLIIMKLRQTSNHYHINNRTIYTIIINNRIICITISIEVSMLIVFFIVGLSDHLWQRIDQKLSHRHLLCKHQILPLSHSFIILIIFVEFQLFLFSDSLRTRMKKERN